MVTNSHEHTHQRLLCVAVSLVNIERLQPRLCRDGKVAQQTHQTHEISGFI